LLMDVEFRALRKQPEPTGAMRFRQWSEWLCFNRSGAVRGCVASSLRWARAAVSSFSQMRFPASWFGNCNGWRRRGRRRCRRTYFRRHGKTRHGRHCLRPCRAHRHTARRRTGPSRRGRDGEGFRHPRLHRALGETAPGLGPLDGVAANRPALLKRNRPERDDGCALRCLPIRMRACSPSTSPPLRPSAAPSRTGASWPAWSSCGGIFP